MRSRSQPQSPLSDVSTPPRTPRRTPRRGRKKQEKSPKPATPKQTAGSSEKAGKKSWGSRAWNAYLLSFNGAMLCLWIGYLAMTVAGCCEKSGGFGKKLSGAGGCWMGDCCSMVLGGLIYVGGVMDLIQMFLGKSGLENAMDIGVEMETICYRMILGALFWMYRSNIKMKMLVGIVCGLWAMDRIVRLIYRLIYLSGWSGGKVLTKARFSVLRMIHPVISMFEARLGYHCLGNFEEGAGIAGIVAHYCVLFMMFPVYGIVHSQMVAEEASRNV